MGWLEPNDSKDQIVRPAAAPGWFQICPVPRSEGRRLLEVAGEQVGRADSAPVHLPVLARALNGAGVLDFTKLITRGGLLHGILHLEPGTGRPVEHARDHRSSQVVVRARE